MKLNWNFLEAQGVQNKKPSVGGLWIFSGTVHLLAWHAQVNNVIALQIHVIALLRIWPRVLEWL